MSKSYTVTIDYVACTNIVVCAKDEDDAAELVERYIATRDGQEDLLRRINANRNVPDGFEIAYVEEAKPRIDLYEWDVKRAEGEPSLLTA